MSAVGSAAIDVSPTDVQVALIAPAAAEAGLCSMEPVEAETSAPQVSATLQSEADDSNTSTECPADMVEVQGEYCQVVEQICEEYISEKRDRCAKYRNKVRCFGKTTNLHFCIDRYEYPNRVGEKPTVAVSYNEANELCAAEGKRLCTANEWTQACEGPERQPYAYGFSRNADACNHDKPYIMPNDQAYQDLATRAAEIARVDQSEPSGSRPGCVSSYGVFDMTGNVDEWVYNEAGSLQGPEYDSGLKGGYWGPVRNRCRPMTADHNRWHNGYQIGFRCCADPSQADKSHEATPSQPNDELRSAETSQEVGRS
jgi:hypothetical protein